MFHQFKLILVLILHVRLFLECHAASDICSKCNCQSSQTNIDCSSRGLTAIPQPIPLNVVYLKMGYNSISEIKAGTFQNLSSLQILELNDNKIKEINAAIFQNLPSLATLELGGNNIKEIKPGTFQNLLSLTTLSLWSNEIKEISAETFRNIFKLTTLNFRNNSISEIKADTFQNLFKLTHLNLGGNKIKEIKIGTLQYLYNLIYLSLWGNEITEIKAGTFQNLTSLKELYLRNSQIHNYEDGAFLFLPSLNKIDLNENKDMMCGCHLPALVDYMNKTLNRSLNVMGECRSNSGNNQNKLIPILEYKQCKNYSLFQRNLQCQSCSEKVCNDSDVATCTGDEPVCRSKTSMDGVTLKFEKSCSTYRKCLEDLKKNTITCSKWTTGSSCVTCCTGDLCKTNYSISLENKLQTTRQENWKLTTLLTTEVFTSLSYYAFNNSFVFHLISNSKLKQFNKSISRAMEHVLSNLTGTFEVEYCGFENGSEAFTITCTVPDTITKDQVLKQIFEAFKASVTFRDFGFRQWNMDEMVCIKSTTTTSKATFDWPTTKIGTTATIPCQENVATRSCSSRQAADGQMATRQNETSPKCPHFTGVWQEPDMSQCYKTLGITERLKNIKNEDIDKGNVDEVSKKLLDISEKSAYFKEEDIGLAVDIQEKMLPLISNVSTNISVNNILPSINNMLNTPEEILIEAEKVNRTGNRILDVIDAIVDNIPLEGQQLTFSYSNAGFGITKVEKDTFNGLLYGVLYGNNEAEVKTTIYNTTHTETPQERTKNMNFISLPKSLIKHLKKESLSILSRISFTSMPNDKIYSAIQKSSSKANATINSPIIAATIPNISITNLDEPITISFNLIDQNATNLRCVYWDKILGNWSTEGCKRSDGVHGKNVFCSCNHLTSFAILVDASQGEEKPFDPVLSIMSNIGCGISLFCLILTIIIHICSKNLRKLMVSKILVNLCISLAITNLIFLAGMQPYVPKEYYICEIVAALMHYFLLATAMWMAVEAVNVFLGVIVVFKTYQKSFLLRSSLVAWGLPVIIVIITLVINFPNNYQIKKNAEVCWLTTLPLYAAFLAPLLFILLINLIIFVVVITRLISMEKDEMLEHKKRKSRIWGIIGLIFLFGLSWVLGLFIFGEATELFTILFIVFNTLQGFFIFIFYCLYKKDTRDAICLCICKREKSRKDVTSNKYPSSNIETQEEKIRIGDRKWK